MTTRDWLVRFSIFVDEEDWLTDPTGTFSNSPLSASFDLCSTRWKNLDMSHSHPLLQLQTLEKLTPRRKEHTMITWYSIPVEVPHKISKPNSVGVVKARISMSYEVTQGMSYNEPHVLSDLLNLKSKVDSV
jgi:hypothetical protein